MTMHARFNLLLLILTVSLALGQNPSSSPATPEPDLKTDASGSLSSQQIQDLFRKVADNDLENDKRQRDYTYMQREEQHRLDGKG